MSSEFPVESQRIARCGPQTEQNGSPQKGVCFLHSNLEVLPQGAQRPVRGPLSGPAQQVRTIFPVPHGAPWGSVPVGAGGAGEGGSGPARRGQEAEMWLRQWAFRWPASRSQVLSGLDGTSYLFLCSTFRSVFLWGEAERAAPLPDRSPFLQPCPHKAARGEPRHPGSGEAWRWGEGLRRLRVREAGEPTSAPEPPGSRALAGTIAERRVGEELACTTWVWPDTTCSPKGKKLGLICPSPTLLGPIQIRELDALSDNL